jgi:hypothetical protein
MKSAGPKICKSDFGKEHSSFSGEMKGGRLHGLKIPRELPQRPVHHLPQWSQRMAFGRLSSRGQVTEHLLDLDSQNVALKEKYLGFFLKEV